MLKLITQHADEKIAEQESAPPAPVDPFAAFKARLGQGARYADLPKSDDPQDSPVYLPGDPRLAR